MSVVTIRAFAVFAGISWAAAVSSAQQAGYSPISSRTVSTGVQPTNYERNTGRNNPALNFFGGAKTASYGAHVRTVQPPPPVAVQTQPLGKPFSGYRPTSPISPYLGLDYFEDSVGLPNYYMFVRPQIDQQHLNRVQQGEYRRLRQTVRQASSGGAITSPAGGIPTTGHSSQFMNNGGYYPTVR